MFSWLFFSDSHPGQVLAFFVYFRPGAPAVFGFKTAEDPDRRCPVGARGLGEIYALVQKEARPPGDDVGAGGRDSDAIVVRRLVGAGPRALGHGGRGLVRVFGSRARRLVAVGFC